VSVLARLIHIIGAPNVSPDLPSVATNLVATTHTLNAYTFSTCSTQMTDPSELWTEEGSRSRMRTDFADFVPWYVAASFRDDHQQCING